MRPERLVAIGTSAGGVETLKRLVAGLPADTTAAFCVVIHMSPMQSESYLPGILRTVSAMPVHNAVSGERIEAGHVYLAPPNRHFLLHHCTAVLNVEPTENRHRPAIDVLFRSVASAFGRNAIGVILTGMLDDGAAGLVAIKNHGGIAVVQSPEDADFPQMPMNALKHVSADHIVPLSDMPALLTSLCLGVIK